MQIGETFPIFIGEDEVQIDGEDALGELGNVGANAINLKSA